MHRFKTPFIVSLICLALSACATPDGPPFVLKPPVTDKTTIYAFRIASIVGGGNAYITAINGKFIGRLDSGTYARYVTKPGKQLVTMKSASIFFGEGEESGWGLGAVVGALDGYIDMLEFDALPGEYYFVQIPDGALIDKDEALEMMDRLEDITPTADLMLFSIISKALTVIYFHKSFSQLRHLNI